MDRETQLQIEKEDREFHALLEKLRRAEYALFRSTTGPVVRAGRLVSANITLREVVDRLKGRT